jgi:hypothetical protein
MGAVALLKLVVSEEAVSPAVVLIIGGAATTAAYIGCLYMLRAVPVEIHDGLVRPLSGRLRLRR